MDAGAARVHLIVPHNLQVASSIEQASEKCIAVCEEFAVEETYPRPPPLRNDTPMLVSASAPATSQIPAFPPGLTTHRPDGGHLNQTSANSSMGSLPTNGADLAE